MEVAVMAGMIRLDKFLAEMKKGTRSQVKEAVRKGRVTVDGAVCRRSEFKIGSEKAAPISNSIRRFPASAWTESRFPMPGWNISC